MEVTFQYSDRNLLFSFVLNVINGTYTNHSIVTAIEGGGVEFPIQTQPYYFPPKTRRVLWNLVNCYSILPVYRCLLGYKRDHYVHKRNKCIARNLTDFSLFIYSFYASPQSRIDKIFFTLNFA